MALWWRYQGSKIRLFAAYLVAEAGGWPERVAKTLRPRNQLGNGLDYWLIDQAGIRTVIGKL